MEADDRGAGRCSSLCRSSSAVCALASANGSRKVTIPKNARA